MGHGASKGNPGLAGAGGIIRGSRGELLELFSLDRGACSCTKAEILGVFRGLLLASNGNHRKVIVTVDSEVVACLLLGASPLNSLYIHVIRKCKALMALPNWGVCIEHCYHEANHAADWLANFGVTRIKS